MIYNDLSYRNYEGDYCSFSVKKDEAYIGHGMPNMLIKFQAFDIFGERKNDYLEQDEELACTVWGYIVRARLIQQLGIAYDDLLEDTGPLVLRWATNAFRTYTHPAALDYFYLSDLRVPKQVENYKQVLITILRDLRLICGNIFGTIPEAILCSPTEMCNRVIDLRQYWSPCKYYDIYAQSGFISLPATLDPNGCDFMMLFDCERGNGK